MKYSLKSAPLNLVVDLDGTFFETMGREEDPLYQLIFENRGDITLIFNTGRNIASVQSALTTGHFPLPDFVIGDVGASAFDFKNSLPIREIEDPIENRWPGKNKILELAQGLQGLIPQDVQQERRCSFYFDPLCFDAKAFAETVSAYGCDVLLSAGRFLDVIPRGVSKGETAIKLLMLYQLDRRSTLFAGDTLNDLSMFKLGMPAVAVGKSESGLIEAASKIRTTIISDKVGSLGVLDGLIKVGFVEKCETHHQTSSRKSELVMVYHRQPFDEIKTGGKTTRQLPKSPNGIIPTLLGLFSSNNPGSWVAWSHHDSNKDKFESHVAVDPVRYPNLVSARVPLSNEDVNIFYKKFSKEALWPIIFSFPSKIEINHAHWEHFKKINRLFASQAAAESEKNGLVWIHDYNLWLTPYYLRKLRPDLKIAFFHHTSFPGPDIFNVLPWRREIVESLIQCDHIGFHIPRYVENFVDVARSAFDVRVTKRSEAAPRFLHLNCALGVDSYATKIEIEGHSLSLGAHPVGIDTERIRTALSVESVRHSIKNLEQEIKGRMAVLSVERLDYVKGPVEKVAAFEELLDKHPELHGKIVFINIVTPPAPGMDVYRQTREKLDQVIGRVNGRFANVDWTPIRYFYRSFSFEELMAFYAVSDIAWITPLRDGLNLVCKEFVEVKAQTQRLGTLVLSEFAGASVELHGALLTNPFDSRSLTRGLMDAIAMSDAERAARLQKLSSIIRENDVTKWGEGFLQALRDTPTRKAAL